MLRYYLIATAIVLLAGIVAGALHKSGGPELRIASVQSTASPSPPRAQATTSHGPRPPSGDAPWAMSAVPECFRQRREVHGPTAYVRKALPASARPVAAGTTVVASDCTLRVGTDSLELHRGSESLRVPPEATLYALGGNEYALFRSDEHGVVLRFYETSAR
jgi:hypothetical protein